MFSKSMILAIMMATCFLDPARALEAGLRSTADAVPTVLQAESIMERANSTMQEFSSQAEIMQKRVIEQLTKSEEELRAQKEAFEAKLKEQEDTNVAIEGKIQGVRQENHALMAEIEDTRREVLEARRTNDELRSILGASETKINTAHEFVVESLRRTDTSDKEELKVLQPKTKSVSLERLLTIAREELQIKGDTHHRRKPHSYLLQMDKDKELWPNRAEEYVEGVTKRIGQLQEAQEQGAAKLKAEFIKSYQLGEERHSELVAKENEVVANKAKLKESLADLRKARSVLEDTHKTILQHIGGLRTFARKLDKALQDAVDTVVGADDLEPIKVEKPIKPAPVKETKESTKTEMVAQAAVAAEAPAPPAAAPQASVPGALPQSAQPPMSPAPPMPPMPPSPPAFAAPQNAWAGVAKPKTLAEQTPTSSWNSWMPFR